MMHTHNKTCVPPRIAVAVSGGPDSMALALLAQQWALRRPLPVTIVPVIVNHHLRPESTDECLWTAQALRNKGLFPCVVDWHHGPIVHGIMAKARNNRYERLAWMCHKLNISTLLVGHHQDDVLETWWMRNQNNSTPYGLAGMSAVTKRMGITIMRPLLSWSKEHLKDVLRHHNQPWIEDPTNRNPCFMRTRARTYVQNLSACERKTLISQCRDYAHRRMDTEYALSEHCAFYDHTTYLHIPWTTFLNHLPPPDGAIILRAWLSFFTPKQHYAHRLYTLWTTIQRAMGRLSQESKIIACGGGCVFYRKKNTLCVIRQSDRLPPTNIHDAHAVWDSRWFAYNTPIQPPRPCEHGPILNRLITGAIPSNHANPALVYHPCGHAYPSFTVHVPWQLDALL